MTFATSQVLILRAGKSLNSLFGNWSVCLTLCQYHTIIITIPLKSVCYLVVEMLQVVFLLQDVGFFLLNKETMLAPHAAYRGYCVTCKMMKLE